MLISKEKLLTLEISRLYEENIYFKNGNVFYLDIFVRYLDIPIYLKHILLYIRNFDIFM